MRYHEIINELFIKPTGVQWELEQDAVDEVLYSAVLPDSTQIIFSAKSQSYWKKFGGIWEILFGTMDQAGEAYSYDIVKSGNAPTVFAAVAECLRNFMQERKPDGLQFSAKEASRQKLYRKLAQKIANEMGWEIHVEDSGVLKDYIAYDPKLRVKPSIAKAAISSAVSTPD